MGGRSGTMQLDDCDEYVNTGAYPTPFHALPQTPCCLARLPSVAVAGLLCLPHSSALVVVSETDPATSVYKF